MPDRRASPLVETPLGRAYDVCCRAPRSGYGPTERGDVAQVILPRRGVFVVQRRGERIVVDTTTAILLGGDEEYSVGHPRDGGDDCTVLVLPPVLLEDSVGSVAGAVGRLTPQQHLAVCLMTRTLRMANGDHLEADDAAMLLLATVASAFARNRSERRLGPGQRARVEAVRALLAASPAAHWDLRAVAAAVHCSPFHLARQFRAATGESISRYVLRLRLAAAVERLAGGETDLSMLAVELGFSHHSHFSARFRSVFGMAPSAARKALTRPHRDVLQAVVASAAPAA